MFFSPLSETANTKERTYTYCTRIAQGTICIALLYVIIVEWQFYRGTARFLPGAEIRPMSTAAKLGFAGFGSILVGGACALGAMISGVSQRRWSRILFALALLAATWIPLIAGYWMFHYIVELRKLVLED
ncbi:hypothetical protein [Chthoniobacter flavus]|uniref:hypothetical protein n=1 Tax=Chthoniobacter flavus TaxID=191863 RepID=UPI0010465828|nr:hypothetical protein [Chthoniobacter flavus]